MIHTIARQAGTADEARAAALIEDAIATGLISPLDIWPALRRSLATAAICAASQCRLDTHLMLDADKAGVTAYAADLDAAARTLRLEAERRAYLNARALVREHGHNALARDVGISGMVSAVHAFRELQP
jgi:hypothetical protein